MSTTPENPHIGKHDPQREADWNDGFEESRAHFTARIAELEAQVRERDEALKVAGESLRWLVNVVCGVGKSGDYPSISEDGAAVDAAKSALAHPLIGGTK